VPFDRLEIAHLADENDSGSAAARCGARARTIGCHADLALVDDDRLSRWRYSDRVLDRHECAVRLRVISSIIAASVVLLPAAGSCGHEHQPAFSAAIRFKHRGQGSSSIVPHASDDAEDHADRAALLDRVAAEPAEAARCTRGRPRGSP